MSKKVVIAAGGTGGHLYPAQSLAKELKKRLDVVFIGGGLLKNPFFEAEDFPHYEVASAYFSKTKNPLKACLTLLRGTLESIRILKKENPDLIIGFGSFHSFPVLLAAKWMRKEIYLHEQNRQMGKVNRFFARKAKKVFTTFPKTFPNYNENNHLVKLPLRFQKQDHHSKKERLKSLGLKPDLKTILVTGGSQGARFINEIFIHSLSAVDPSSFQVIHLVGKNDNAKDYESFYKSKNILSYVKSFEPQMCNLLCSADFVITRAGASSINEMLEFEIPALMIPYPYAKNHQEHNANFFEKEVGGGVLLNQKKLSKDLFKEKLKEFFENEKITAYRHAIKAYKTGQKMDDLTQLILKELGV